MAAAHGIEDSSSRHWSIACGCERTVRICSSGTGPSVSSACLIGITVWPWIDSSSMLYSRSCVSATGPASELSMGSTA